MEILSDYSISQRYNIANIPLYIRRETIYDFPGHKTVPHWNDGLELVYINKGSMYIVVCGKKHLLSSEDICIINPGCVHYFESCDDKNCAFYCGVVKDSLFSTSESIVENYINPLFHAYKPSLDFIPADSEYNKPISSVIQHINNLAIEQPTAYDLQIIALCHECLALLCKAINHSFMMPVSSKSRNDSSFQTMLDFIQRNYSKPIYIQDICDSAFISRNQCFALFKKYTGDTPANFLLKYRLNISKNYLMDSDMPIAQISSVCGFAHQSHYSNHFSNYYGMTPLQFRKSRAKNNLDV